MSVIDSPPSEPECGSRGARLSFGFFSRWGVAFWVEGVGLGIYRLVIQDVPYTGVSSYDEVYRGKCSRNVGKYGRTLGDVKPFVLISVNCGMWDT